MSEVDNLAATIRAALSDAVFHGEVGYEQAVEALDALVAEARRAQEMKRVAKDAGEELKALSAGYSALEADRDTYRSAWNRAEADAVALRSKVERYEDALRCVEHWARNADLTPAQFWAVDRLTHEVLHHADALSNPTATTEEEPA